MAEIPPVYSSLLIWPRPAGTLAIHSAHVGPQAPRVTPVVNAPACTMTRLGWRRELRKRADLGGK